MTCQHFLYQYFFFNLVSQTLLVGQLDCIKHKTWKECSHLLYTGPSVYSPWKWLQACSNSVPWLQFLLQFGLKFKRHGCVPDRELNRSASLSHILRRVRLNAFEAYLHTTKWEKVTKSQLLLFSSFWSHFKKQKFTISFHKFSYGRAIVNSLIPITLWKGFSSCVNCLWKYHIYSITLYSITESLLFLKWSLSVSKTLKEIQTEAFFAGFIVFYVLTDMTIVRNLKLNSREIQHPRRANVHNMMRTVNFHIRVYLILLQPLFWIWPHQERHLHWWLPFTR